MCAHLRTLMLNHIICYADSVNSEKETADNLRVSVFINGARRVSNGMRKRKKKWNSVHSRQYIAIRFWCELPSAYCVLLGISIWLTARRKHFALFHLLFMARLVDSLLFHFESFSRRFGCKFDGAFKFYYATNHSFDGGKCCCDNLAGTMSAECNIGCNVYRVHFDRWPIVDWCVLWMNHESFDIKPERAQPISQVLVFNWGLKKQAIGQTLGGNSYLAEISRLISDHPSGWYQRRNGRMRMCRHCILLRRGQRINICFLF